jgi:hypothetical protein
VSEVVVKAVDGRKSCCKLVNEGGGVGLIKYRVSLTDSSKMVYYPRLKELRCLETASFIIGGM